LNGTMYYHVICEDYDDDINLLTKTQISHREEQEQIVKFQIFENDSSKIKIARTKTLKL